MSALPIGELNSIKTKFSEAFLYSINARANLALNRAERDFDGEGIDFSIINRSVGVGRAGRDTASESQTIHIQLKAVSVCSKSMLKEDGDSIQYNLTKSLEPIGIFYLVVVVLPEVDTLDTWLEIGENQLILKRCAYFIRLTEKQNAGFVTIPKANRLTPDTLNTLFLTESNKEELL